MEVKHENGETFVSQTEFIETLEPIDLDHGRVGPKSDLLRKSELKRYRGLVG